MGGWTVIVGFLFPIPLVALLLLSVPLPSFLASPVRKGVNWVVSKVLFAKLFGSLGLFHIAVLLSTFLFVDASIESFKANSDRIKNFEDGGSLSFDEKLKCTIFRNERNFWIAAFSLSLWIVLYRVQQFTSDIEQLKSQLKAKDAVKKVE